MKIAYKDVLMSFVFLYMIVKFMELFIQYYICRRCSATEKLRWMNLGSGCRVLYHRVCEWPVQNISFLQLLLCFHLWTCVFSVMFMSP